VRVPSESDAKEAAVAVVVWESRTGEKEALADLSMTYPPPGSRPGASVQATTYVCPTPTLPGGTKAIVGPPGALHVPATVKLWTAKVDVRVALHEVLATTFQK
jgi:hypothetical protein